MIVINGKQFSGNNLTITNGNVYVDGDLVSDKDEKTINIIVNGDIDVVNVDNCNKLEITGKCGEVSSKNGNISINGDVGGYVDSKNGNIMCNNVGGSVNTKNGNISKCGK